MNTVLTRWHEIVESDDPAERDRMLADLLDDDAVFRSPAIHTPQEGRALTTAYLKAAMVVLGPTLHYRREWSRETPDRSAILEFTAEVGGKQVHGIDMITWNDANRITEFTVMVRPLQGLTALIEQMAAQLQHG